MKRLLAKLVVFLILGAIVNVTIAWACAIWSDASLDSLVISNATQEDLDLFVQIGWISKSESENSTSNYKVKNTKGFGVSDSFLIEEMLGVRDLPQYSASFPRPVRIVTIVAHSHQTGWPLRCFSDAYYDQTGIGIFGASKSKFLQQTISDDEDDGILTFYITPQVPFEDWEYPMSLPVPDKIGPIPLPADRYIPLRPIWSSFIINTIFYAIVLWLMMLFGATARRHSRLKNGHCPSCNYNLRSDYSSGCPECGWGREAEA